MSQKIQIRRGLSASIPTLDTGEFGWTTDTEELFIGNSGTNVLVGGLFVSGIGTGTGVDADWIDGGNILRTTSSVAIDPDGGFASAAGTDVFFYVSGAISGSGTSGVSVFGGDLRVSGVLAVGTGSVFITSNNVQFGGPTTRIELLGSDLLFFDANNPSGQTLTQLAAGGGGPSLWTDEGSAGVSQTGSVTAGGNVGASGFISASLGFSGSLHRLTNGSPAFLAGPNVTITSASNGAITIAAATSAGSGDPNATYVVFSATGSLTSERVASGGLGIELHDNGPGNALNINIVDSIVATVSGTTFTGNILTSGNLEVSGTTLIYGETSIGDPGFEQGTITYNSGTFDAILKVNDINSNRNALAVFHRHSTVDAANIVFVRAKSDDATHAPVEEGDQISRFYFAGWASGSGGAGYVPAAFIDAVVDAPTSGGAMPGRLDFSVTPPGTSTPVRQLRLNNSGTIVENNAHISGVTRSELGFSGSLTRLFDGSPAWIAGDNMLITSASNGAVTFHAITGSGGGGIDVDWTDNGGNLSTTSSLNVENQAFFQGPITSSLGFSGSLQRLADGSPAFIAGANITITSASNGAITIASTAAQSGTGSNQFNDFIAVGGYTNVSTTAEQWIRIKDGGSSTTKPNIGNVAFIFSAPKSGAVDCISILAQNDPGSTVFRVYKNFETNASAFVTGSPVSNGSNFIGSFQYEGTTTFNPGDHLIFSVDPTNNPINATLDVVIALENTASFTGGGVDVDWIDNGGNLSTTSSLNVENDASFSGVVTASLGFSGSLQRLTDGSPAFIAGDNVLITSQSNGAITIHAVTGAGGGSDVDWVDQGGFLYTTSSIAIGESSISDSSIQFLVSGATELSGTLTVSGTIFLGSSSLQIQHQIVNSVSSVQIIGTSGTLYSVSDSLSGSLFAVTDISSLPLFEVFSDGRIVAGDFGQNDFVVTGGLVGLGTAGPSKKLDIIGSARATLGFSGSHTHLADGSPAFIAGDNVLITSQSNGAVTIASVPQYVGWSAPTTPSVYDDEFRTSGSLDVKWSIWDVDNSFSRTPAVYNEKLGVSLDTDFTSAMCGIYQVAPTGSFTIYGRMVLPAPNDGQSKGLGLFVGENLSSAPSTANVYTIAIQTNIGAGYDAGVRTWTDYNSPLTWTFEDIGQAGTPLWMRLIYDETNDVVTGSWSLDGRTWQTTSTDTLSTVGITIASMGIFAFNFTTDAGSWKSQAQNFRFVAGIPDRFDPIPSADYESGV